MEQEASMLTLKRRSSARGIFKERMVNGFIVMGFDR
jgi:hypothetical protein